MQYRKMPNLDESLSVLGFGCMRLPQKDGRIDEERARAMIRNAIDKGVNYIDTALPYHMGQSEPFVGRTLLDGYRDKVQLATKLPPWQVKTAEDMDKLLDSQLERLQTRQIDFYLVHSLAGESWDRMRDLGVCEFLDKAKADGRIRHAGFSFHGTQPDFFRIVDSYDWQFCQIQYNYMDTDNQAGRDGLIYANKKGLGVIVMEPLRGGWLARKEPQKIEKIWNEQPPRRTPAARALRWVWNHPQVTVVLSGMSTEEQLAENLALADEAQSDILSSYELDQVERVARAFRQEMKIGCTGCAYCTPCPAGVSIHQCFEFYNSLFLFGHKQSEKIRYTFRTSGAVTGGKPSDASQCVQCGKCLEHCPQNLNIPELLTQVKKEFGGLGGWARKRLVKLFLWNQRRKMIKK